MSELNYKQWFWTECDELNKDTIFAYRLAEKAWNHQQTKIDAANEILKNIVVYDQDIHAIKQINELKDLLK